MKQINVYNTIYRARRMRSDERRDKSRPTQPYRPETPSSSPQSPKYGDQRIITRFAWLPIHTLDNDRRWLQRVRIRQIYITGMRKFGFGSVWSMRWVNGEFVT